jgi:hypothetical protein
MPLEGYLLPEERIRAGPTLNDTRDPEVRLKKLIERRSHISDQIAELEDRWSIIDWEILEIVQNKDPILTSGGRR